MKFSILIPCYNEFTNLKSLIDYILPLQDIYELEYILVENGSTDNSREYFQNNIDGKYKNIKIAYVDTNKGYGFGIQQGLKLCKGEYLGWIHADMQVLPNELRKLFDYILLKGSNQKLFLKGRRFNRPLLDRFFTIGQSMFSSIIFLNKMWDIGATPVIFSKSLIDNFDLMPDDFSIELFTYLIAKRKDFQIKRFDITINDRKNSISSWNNGLISKIKLSLILIKSSILIRLNGTIK
jgi:glycosyltransferase involved in cell wall biosynthesis